MSVDRIDYLERDMNIWYHIECIDEHGVVSHYEISIPKWLPEEGLEEIPFLKKQGWILDLNVKNTPFDFTTTKTIGKEIEKVQQYTHGYDVTFALRNQTGKLALAAK